MSNMIAKMVYIFCISHGMWVDQRVLPTVASSYNMAGSYTMVAKSVNVK